ncbi:MAG TPA: hypothetical protein DDZ84_08130 [Firmicutes bacterium]|nr:hypothetical protein [Bacillota bacterium]
MSIANPGLDHTNPLGKGGTDNLSNSQLLCERCTGQKGAGTPGHVCRTETHP